MFFPSSFSPFIVSVLLSFSPSPLYRAFGSCVCTLRMAARFVGTPRARGGKLSGKKNTTITVISFYRVALRALSQSRVHDNFGVCARLMNGNRVVHIFFSTILYILD